MSLFTQPTRAGLPSTNNRYFNQNAIDPYTNIYNYLLRLKPTNITNENAAQLTNVINDLIFCVWG